MVKGLGAVKCVLLYLCMALFVLSISASHLWAQAQTATISGTATDATGAAMVGAKIQATNTETNVSQSTVSDSQGRYTIPDLPVGTYSVQASQSGFRTVIHTGVTLSVGGAVVVDFSMPVGEVSQTVSVEGQVSRVETTTSEVSTLVSPQQMRELPLNGRNFEQLLTLAPGVSTIPPAENFVTGRLYGMMDNYSISGMRPTGQMFLLDGTDIRDFWEHATGSGYGGTSLGVEAIGQFQVLTNSYTAQYAGNGAVINAVSRAGTNDLHGGAYEFIRNSAFDARDIADVFGGRTSPPPFKRNQFGVAIGGPIKKDKLFFFGNYEGLRQGLESTVPGNIPEPYMAAGMLPCYSPINGSRLNSSSSCPSAPPPGGPYPAVNTAGNPIEAVSPFGGGGIPQANTALALMQKVASLYSLCNGCLNRASTQFVNGVPTLFPAGADLGGYYAISTLPNLIINEDYTLGRVDYTFSSSDNIFVRYVLDDARVGDNPRDALGIYPEKDFTRNQFLTISENHIISATTVNSIRFGYVRNNENSRVPLSLTSGQIAKASAASVAAGGAAFTTDPLDMVRTLYGEPQREDAQFGPDFIAGITPIGPDPNRPDAIIQSKFSGGDDLSLTHGAHSVKIGVVVTRVDTNNIQAAYANGEAYYFIFSLQGFLQGSTAAAYAAPPGDGNSTRYFRQIDVAPYIQDDWKVTPRLTLNFGIRYDFSTNPVGWASGNQRMTSLATFGPPTGILATAPTCTSPPLSYVQSAQCALGIFTPIKHVFLNNPNAANWGPRFGFAYSPFADNKTAIRGGFGLFHDPVSARTYESGLIATPPAASFNLGPPFYFPGPCVPDAFTQVPGYCGPALPVPAEFAGVDYIMPNGSPYDMQYNLGIQRQLTAGTILTVGYVGSLGRHLFMQRDINIPKCDTYPNCLALPSVKAPNTGVSFTKFLAQTPGYGRINPALGSMVTELNNVSSSYSSLQVSLNRQFAHNLAGQVNYTWSHCIDNGSFTSSLEEFGALLFDSYNPRNDYGNCNFDIRQNLSINGLYELPFKGNRLVEGWRLSSITGIHTGLPIDVRNNAFAGDPTNLGTQAGSRPNYSFAPGCSPNHVVDKVVGPGVVQWFDTACYTPQAAGFLGDVGRNSIPGPGGIGVDFSITKETKLTEKLNMEFRAEFFNIINHLNLNSPGVINALNTFSPIATGQVNSSSGTPRQIQFAVKFDF